MKKNLKKWGIIVLVTFVTVFVCYGTGEFFSYTSFVFSWTLNFLLMYWYSILISQLNPKLDFSYFNQKPFERNGKIYKYFGVHIYRKFLVLIGWEKINKKNNPVKNDLQKLKLCEYNTRLSELDHLIIAMTVFITGIFLADSLAQAKWFIITNVFLNIYPILVQRFNRPRYRRLIGMENFHARIF